jgi:hypothetical protein
MCNHSLKHSLLHRRLIDVPFQYFFGFPYMITGKASHHSPDKKRGNHWTCPQPA